jgi:valyl-tRNA synthetase
MDNFDLALGAQKIYDLIWNEFCDWYVELVKSRLYGQDEADREVVRRVLVTVLKDMLRLLHPFMPFITEEIWSNLPEREGYLITDRWPVYSEARAFPEEAARMELAMDLIRAIRNIRAEAEAPAGKKLHAVILAEPADREKAEQVERHIRELAGVLGIRFVGEKKDVPEEVMSAVVGRVEVYIPLDELVDYQVELQRLGKEKERLEGEVARIGKTLANEAFVSKAPAKVVDGERAKLAAAEETLEKVRARLAAVEAKVK